VAGARLSGGGFGGCVLVLTGTDSAAGAASALSAAYEKRFGRPCDCRSVRPSRGARLV